MAVSSTSVWGPDASLFSIDSGGGAFSLVPDDPDEPSVVVAIRNRSHTPGVGFPEIVEVSQGSGGNTVGPAAQTQLVPTPAAVASSGTISSTVDWAVVAVEVRAG